MTSANIVFEIASHGHPVEVSGDVFEIFRGSHECHLFMRNGQEFALMLSPSCAAS